MDRIRLGHDSRVKKWLQCIEDVHVPCGDIATGKTWKIIFVKLEIFITFFTIQCT